MNHRNRSLCYALLGLACALRLRDGAGWQLAIVAVQFLVYPQLLLWHVRASTDQRRAENRNMAVDTLIFGGWAGALGFPLWITVSTFIGATVNLGVFGGARGFAAGAAGAIVGALVGATLDGWHFAPQTDAPTTAAAIAALLVYLYLVTLGAHGRAVKLQDTRRILRHREVELKAAHASLRRRFDQVVALQQQLRQQAERDPLTGLFNRRQLESELGGLLARCLADGSSLALLLIDVDHFKRINDAHGHQAGDAVLRRLATTLGTRSGDIAGRYGGDEFMVLLPGVDAQGALAWARRCREGFADGAGVATTLSIGIACFPAAGADADALIAAADAALYAAKAAGRDQAVLGPAAAPERRSTESSIIPTPALGVEPDLTGVGASAV